MKWWRLKRVDDDLNDLPDWVENEVNYTPQNEEVHYYNGQFLGADVLAESLEEAKKKADFLRKKFSDDL